MNYLFRGAETWTKSRLFKTAKYNSRDARTRMAVAVKQMDTMLIYSLDVIGVKKFAVRER